MNRYLMAGCAATALVVGASAANAQTQFKVLLSGDAIFQAGYVSQKQDTNSRSTDFVHRIRINIIPSAKADNGLEYGARLRFRAQNADSSVNEDKAFLFAQGAFGRVELGQRASWNDDNRVYRPTDWNADGQTDDPGAFTFASGAAATAIDSNQANTAFGMKLRDTSMNPGNNGHRIAYSTPVFSGFDLGLTYLPESNGANKGVTRDKRGNLQDVWEAAIRYKGEFSGIGLQSTFSYMGGQIGHSTTGQTWEHLQGYHFGAAVSYAGFTVGGSYMNTGKSGLPTDAAFKKDRYSWTVGGQYVTGPWAFGVGYMYGTDAGDATINGTRKMDFITAGMKYVVAPGLAVGAEYWHINYKNNDIASTSTSYKDNADVFILKTGLSF